MTCTPAAWLSRGQYLTLSGGRVFTVDVPAGPAATPRVPVLAVHGYPTSSWDFSDAADRLTARGRRVLLYDHIGFGFSDKPVGGGSSVIGHADTAIAVVRAAGIDRLHVWAHDMGTSIATELLARAEEGVLPFELAGLVLMDGGVFVEMSNPGLGQRLLMGRAGPWLARLNSRGLFTRQMRRLFGQPPAPDVLDGMWDLIARERGHHRMADTITFMHERVRFRERWIGALTRATVPVLAAWGRADPVTPVTVGERISREVPGARLVVWDRLGHYPHVEDPGRAAADVADFLDAVDGSIG